MKNEKYFKKLKSMSAGPLVDHVINGDIFPEVEVLLDEETGQCFLVSYKHRKYKETKLGPDEPEIQEFKNLSWKEFE